MKIVCGLSLLVLFTGCISVNTYESRMKGCRDAVTRAKELEGQMFDLREKNRQLESSMGIAEREQEEMRETIQTQEEYITNLRGTYDQLINELKDDISRGDISVHAESGSLSIVMEEKVLFRSGEAELRPQGQAVLSRIGAILKKVKDNFIRIDGHSDNIRITGRLRSRFPSNWELSALRAATVLRYFEENAEVDPLNMFIAAFSMYRPLADNETERGRELNRRVEITLIQKK